MTIERMRKSARMMGLAGLAVLAAAALGCGGHGAKEDAGAGVPLSGTVHLATGQPPAVAHVALEEAGGTNPVELAVDAGGRFEVRVAPGDAMALRLAAPDHEELIVPVCLTSETPASVTVTLAPNPRPETFENIRIIGDFNGFSFSTAEPMTPAGDGTWTWERDGIEGDRFAYQLLGVTTNGHSVNGTMSDTLEYDGGGDFRSIVTVENGSVRIVFDPSKLPPEPEGAAPAVAWDANHADLGKLFEVVRIRDEEQAAAAAAWMAHKENGGEDETLEFDRTPWRKKLMAIAGEKPRTLAARVAFLIAGPEAQAPAGRAWPTKPDPAAAKAILEMVPVDSPAWGYAPEALQRYFVLAGTGPDATKIAERFLEESPVGAVRIAALAALTAIARDSGDETAWRERFAKLKAAVGDSREWRYRLTSLDPDRKIRKGNPVPEFSITRLDGTPFTNENLEGHYTLIDFWATWCHPCVGEMPHLHEAWKKYHGKGFQILSLSLDRSPDDIARFRKKWPMPWAHAYLEKGFGNPIVKMFEVNGIPTPILVGPDGTIVATAPATRGEQLMATLDALYANN